MHNHPTTDHLGNHFNSIKEMCLHYRISTNVYAKREQRGWSLERILTTPVKSAGPRQTGFIMDHLAKDYPDFETMCRAYRIDLPTFYARKNKGWKLEEILTTPLESAEEKCVDHLGRTFGSTTAMCDHYDIPYYVYRYRVQNGWGIERALTEPVREQATSCRDHLGREFASLREMCDHYGVPFKMYQSRIRYGWSVERALTVPKKGKRD